MQIKILEIRDRFTFIPAMAIKIEPRKYNQDYFDIDIYYLRGRCGYQFSDYDIILMNLNDPQKCCYNPHDWKYRTHKTAHRWIITNWKTIKDGDVIDVEFILGETPDKKISERL